MKKIILSSIATITLTIGALIVINMNKQPETIDNTQPETVQSVIEHETVIDAPEQVEAVVEAVKAPVENKVVETPEPEAINREPTFEELVIKYKISGDSRIQELSNLFDRRTRNAPSEDRFLQFMRQLGFDMTESRTIYDRDAVYTNWVKSLNDSSKNN